MGRLNCDTPGTLEVRCQIWIAYSMLQCIHPINLDRIWFGYYQWFLTLPSSYRVTNGNQSVNIYLIWTKFVVSRPLCTVVQGTTSIDMRVRVLLQIPAAELREKSNTTQTCSVELSVLVDMRKTAGVPARAFNRGSQLSCCPQVDRALKAAAADCRKIHRLF